MKPIRLTNRGRMLSPLITCALCVLMFGPLLVVTLLDGPTAKMIGGVVILGGCILWCGVSALRAPFEMTIDDATVRVRRLLGERSSTLGDVRDWIFAIPDALPTRTPPQSNALLRMKLADGTRFRAEVTADEAAAISGLLVSSPRTPGEG